MMFHLQIISATDIYKKGCTSHVSIIPKSNYFENYFDFAETQKIKNDANPNYNESFCIPFYCFNSLQLIFWRKKVFDKESIASANIPLAVDQFVKQQPLTMPIELYFPFDDACPYLKYSFSYVPIQDLPKNENVNPRLVYAYLTYNPPLQLNTQEVHLFVKKIEDNGTIADPSGPNMILDAEPSKCGPSGLTQIFYINHDVLIAGTFFFYIWATGYNGRVTLNFATSPRFVSLTNHNEYCMLNNSFYVDINNQGQPFPVYALFPFVLKLTNTGLKFEPKTVPPEISPQLSTAETNKPESEVIEKSINNCGFKFVFPNRNPVERYEVQIGRRYSIKEAAARNNLTNPVNKLLLTFSYATHINESISVVLSGDGGEAAKHFIFYNNMDTTRPIYFLGYLTSSPEVTTRMVFKLNEIDTLFNYIGIYITYSLTQKLGRDSKPIKRNIYSNGQCSIKDFDSDTELMAFPMETHSSPVHLLVMILHRKENNEWEVCPMMRFYDHLSAFVIDAYRSCQTADMFKEFALTEEFNKIFAD